MNIVVFSKRWARARHYELGHPLALTLLAMAGLLLLGGAYLAGMQSQANTLSAQPATGLQQQQAQIHAIRQQLDDQVADLTARVGQVNAQMLRLNALGKRLTEMAQLDKGEFNFDSLPAQGGPEQVTDEPTAVASDLHEVLTKLETQLIDRERQLVILETFISARQLTQMALPDGSPVPGAWISSQFGRRVDPITGTSAFHSGIDFAAASGAQVYAVAPGVVSWAGDHFGFGQLVEINHGNGYVTRYAHNSRVLVKVGDKVGKGKLISQVGSTGRSTGPHLHFEVLKNGRAVDPRKFVAG